MERDLKKLSVFTIKKKEGLRSTLRKIMLQELVFLLLMNDKEEKNYKNV
jgi:hypothetical protein